MVIFFHSYFGKIKTALFKNIERYLARKSTGIIAISEIQKKELCEIHKIAPKEKTTVIPLGFDLDVFQQDYESNRTLTRTKYEIDENTVAVAIVGRLTAIKDHFFFLEVIEELDIQSDKKVKIFIVGDGDMKSEIEERLIPMQKNGIQILIFISSQKLSMYSMDLHEPCGFLGFYGYQLDVLIPLIDAESTDSMDVTSSVESIDVHGI